MRYVKGDPYWIEARREDACSLCDAHIHRGDRVFYWPKTRSVHCAPCGADSERRFVAECAAEYWPGA